jgi:hypothetical protein
MPVILFLFLSAGIQTCDTGMSTLFVKKTSSCLLFQAGGLTVENVNY